MADHRASRVSFVGDFTDIRPLPRPESLQGRRQSSIYEWTTTAVETVYSNQVYEVALYMLGTTFVLVLLMTFPLSKFLVLFRDDVTVLIASRAALVVSFMTLLSLRSYFSYSIDLIALTAVVVVTSFEVSALTSRCSLGILSVVFFLTTLIVLGLNHAALRTKPNLVVVALLVLVNLLLVTNLNFIAAILQRKPIVVVDLTVTSLSVTFATFSILAFSIVVGDSAECPFEVTDRISSGTILYLLVVYLFASLITLLEIIERM